MIFRRNAPMVLPHNPKQHPSKQVILHKKNPVTILRVFPERIAPSQRIPSRSLSFGRFHQVIANSCRLLKL